LVLLSSLASWISAVRPSRQPAPRLPQDEGFPNAINGVPHPEERPEGASRRTHRGFAADVARVPSVRSVPLAAGSFKTTPPQTSIFARPFGARQTVTRSLSAPF